MKQILITMTIAQVQCMMWLSIEPELRLSSEGYLCPVFSEGVGDANLGAWTGAGLALEPLLTATTRLCAMLQGSNSEVPCLA